MGIRNTSRRPRAAAAARSATSPTAPTEDKKPEKSLLEPLKKKGGRNNQGVICVALPRRRAQADVPHHRLQAHDKDGVGATVVSIEYDPNRSARIALLQYEDGEKTYILAPDGLKAGMTDRQRRRRRAARRQLPAAPEDSARHVGPQRRDAARPRRPDLPLGRVQRDARRPAKATGRRSRCPRAKSAASAASAGRRIGMIWQRRPHEHQPRQGRPQALDGPQAAQPRRVDEPGQPPDGRRRRPHRGGRHPCSPTGVLAKGGKTRKKRKPSNSARSSAVAGRVRTMRRAGNGTERF